MGRIDRFLNVLISRGGVMLRLVPGEPPVMELPGGHRTQLSPQELLGTVLDGLAKEILPEHLQTPYLRGERVDFDHVLDGHLFGVVCTRGPLGTQIILARLGTQATDNEAPPSLGTGGLDPWIRTLLSSGASDLYVAPEELPLLRKDGMVSELSLPPMDAGTLEDRVRPLLSPLAQATLKAGQDTEGTFVPESIPGRLRLRVTFDHRGPTLAIRAVPAEVPAAETLDLPEAVQRLSHLNHGLVLLAGPAGSGRSTTQACLLSQVIQQRSAFAILLQESLEFELPGGRGLLRQREVGPQPDLQLKALRAALQEGPDVLAAGVIRTAEAADLALQAAQAGRLVFAQIGASDAVDALMTFVDLFPPNRREWVQSRLASQLKAVVGHALVPRIGGGRIAAFETLFVNGAIAEKIREGRMDQIPAAMRSGRYGQVTHNEALLRLVQGGQLAIQEAWRTCQDRDSFIAACQKAGIDFDPRADGRITED